MFYCALGTGSSQATTDRNVSGHVMYVSSGSVIIIDCGEGTLRQLQTAKIKLSKIDKILITHLHGDHCFGLPSLLCSISTQLQGQMFGKVICIYGPVGLKDFIRSNLLISESRLTFGVEIYELYVDRTQNWISNKLLSETEVPLIKPTNNIYDLCNDKYILKAALLKHSVTCFGYVIQEHDKPGKLDLNKLNIYPPGPWRKDLINGKDVTIDGKILKSTDYVSSPIPGKKVVILGDTCDSHLIEPIAMKCDLLIHECTSDDDNKAKEHHHSGPNMVGEFANKINCKKLIITHFGAKIQEDDLKKIVAIIGVKFKGQVIVNRDLYTMSID